MEHIPRKTHEEHGRFLDEMVDRINAKNVTTVYGPIALELTISTRFTVYSLACPFCGWAAVTILGITRRSASNSTSCCRPVVFWSRRS